MMRLKLKEVPVNILKETNIDFTGFRDLMGETIGSRPRKIADVII